LIAMALFKSMDTTANMAGTMFPGTIVPINIEGQGLRGYAVVLIPAVDIRRR
jgi:hypothetical protein